MQEKEDDSSDQITDIDEVALGMTSHSNPLNAEALLAGNFDKLSQSGSFNEAAVGSLARTSKVGLPIKTKQLIFFISGIYNYFMGFEQCM